MKSLMAWMKVLRIKDFKRILKRKNLNDLFLSDDLGWCVCVWGREGKEPWVCVVFVLF